MGVVSEIEGTALALRTVLSGIGLRLHEAANELGRQGAIDEQLMNSRLMHRFIAGGPTKTMLGFLQKPALLSKKAGSWITRSSSRYISRSAPARLAIR